jgi:hypothetical protein
VVANSGLGPFTLRAITDVNNGGHLIAACTSQLAGQNLYCRSMKSWGCAA